VYLLREAQFHPLAVFLPIYICRYTFIQNLPESFFTSIPDLARTRMGISI
jgi:hypothetical protein